MRVDKEMLLDVISNTIMLDNLLNEIIRTSFGLEPEWHPAVDIMLNEWEVERFDRFFLQDMGASRKMKIIKEIIEKDFIKKAIFPKDFNNKFLTFYKIRNIFAHSLYPMHVDKKEMPNYLPNDAKWEDLHKQHSDLFKELNDFLMKEVYDNIRINDVLTDDE